MTFIQFTNLLLLWWSFRCTETLSSWIAGIFDDLWTLQRMVQHRAKARISFIFINAFIKLVHFRKQKIFLGSLSRRH